MGITTTVQSATSVAVHYRSVPQQQRPNLCCALLYSANDPSTLERVIASLLWRLLLFLEVQKCGWSLLKITENF